MLIKLNKLNKDLLKYIDEFVNPTEEQLEIWKMEHYLKYFKVIEDINDIITEIKIGRNGALRCVFSLFSWSLLEAEFNDYWLTDEEESDDNRSLVIS